MTATTTRITRDGVTLLELMVALTLIGFMAAVVGLAVPRRASPTPAQTARAALATARRTAIESGASVTVTITVGGTPKIATALPDGSIIADSALAIDRLSGAPEPMIPTSEPARAP